MLLQQEREEIVFFGRKLIASKLTTGSGGNLSIFNRELGYIAIKPTGVDYLEMRPEDVVVINPAGEIVDGKLKPSSEVSLHLGLLQARPEMKSRDPYAPGVRHHSGLPELGNPGCALPGRFFRQ